MWLEGKLTGTRQGLWYLNAAPSKWKGKRFPFSAQDNMVF